MPQVTEGDVEAAIATINFFTAAEGVAASGGPVNESHKLLTLCVCVLQNGYTVLGQSACADPAVFDASYGRVLAYEDAKSKVWPLLGYVLKEKLHAAA